MTIINGFELVFKPGQYGACRMQNRVLSQEKKMHKYEYKLKC